MCAWKYTTKGGVKYTFRRTQANQKNVSNAPEFWFSPELLDCDRRLRHAIAASVCDGKFGSFLPVCGLNLFPEENSDWQTGRPMAAVAVYCFSCEAMLCWFPHSGCLRLVVAGTRRDDSSFDWCFFFLSFWGGEVIKICYLTTSRNMLSVGQHKMATWMGRVPPLRLSWMVMLQCTKEKSNRYFAKTWWVMMARRLISGNDSHIRTLTLPLLPTPPSRAKVVELCVNSIPDTYARVVKNRTFISAPTTGSNLRGELNYLWIVPVGGGSQSFCLSARWKVEWVHRKPLTVFCRFDWNTGNYSGSLWLQW